jgi:hypothetical protein
LELLDETDESPSISRAPVELGDQLLAMKILGVKFFDARVSTSEVRRPYLSILTAPISNVDRNRRVDGIVPGVRNLVGAL